MSALGVTFGQYKAKYPANKVGVTMKKYKYQVTGKTDHEIWVCDACKKANNDLILKGKWKLIDRCSDCAIQCDVCTGNIVAGGKS